MSRKCLGFYITALMVSVGLPKAVSAAEYRSTKFPDAWVQKTQDLRCEKMGGAEILGKTITQEGTRFTVYYRCKEGGPVRAHVYLKLDSNLWFEIQTANIDSRRADHELISAELPK